MFALVRRSRRVLTGRWSLVLLLLAYAVLAIAYSLVSPIYEPTDELRHFRYVRHIAVYHSLPVQSAEGPRAQSHHPPLYYALGAVASAWVPVEQDVYYEPALNPFWGYRYWEAGEDNKNQYVHGLGERFPFRGVTLAVYVVRWLTVLIGVGVVGLTYRIGREVFADRPSLAVGAAAVVAFNPQFLYLSGAVNNDIAAALFGAAVLLACVRLVRDGPSLRADVTLGVLYGLALLTKFNLLALLALVELAYMLAVWPTRDWRAWLRGTLVILGLAAAIAGWWFWRNWVLYADPTGMRKVNELWAGRSAAENRWVLWESLPYLWSSLWGRFGYGQVPLPEPIYRGLLYVSVVALLGHLLRRRSVQPRTLVLLSASVLISVAVVSYYIMIQPAGAMGRFLFPAMGAFAVLVVGGLSRLLPHRPSWTTGVLVAVGMAALAVYALVGVLVPAFGRPAALSEAQIAAAPNPTDVEFGGVARVVGYRVEPTAVRPGGVVKVTVYWRALARTGQAHVVFVHLLSDTGVMVAQRDTYPGLGRYPTTVWEPGAAFADTYHLPVPETAYAPDVGYVQLGIYVPEGPRLTTPDGLDALRLDTVEVLALPGELPNPMFTDFGGRAALVGYELDRRVVRPGESIHLTLYWQGLAPMDKNYSIFVHVVGEGQQFVARSDSWPDQGTDSTSSWEPGEIADDEHDLVIAPTAPPGFYEIKVGMHEGGERLPIVAEDGRWLSDREVLCQIRVIEEGVE